LPGIEVPHLALRLLQLLPIDAVVSVKSGAGIMTIPPEPNDQGNDGGKGDEQRPHWTGNQGHYRASSERSFASLRMTILDYASSTP
jgi:hypothetical protein